MQNANKNNALFTSVSLLPIVKHSKRKIPYLPLQDDCAFAKRYSTAIAGNRSIDDKKRSAVELV